MSINRNLKTKNFYSKQEKLTRAKIEFYKNYIEGYLIKLLMGFGKCFIADLFCGAGKNGNKDGSPLVLINRAKYILTTPQLQNPQIHILFNDKNEDNIQNLEKELKKIKPNRNINISPVQNKSFENILPVILKQFEYSNIPKFFFLDPFTYSNVRIQHLKQIMSLKSAEILLFLPAFSAYRFANSKKFKKDHKTRIFVEEFTVDGMRDYKDINDFKESIKDKLKQELNLDLVRPILLDGGSRKNALFLLTRNEKGMLLMNNLCIKKSKDGSGINIKENYEDTKFLINKKEILKITPRYKAFKANLIAQLKNKKMMTTDGIRKFTIISEFRPQDAHDILKELKKEGKIKFFNTNDKETVGFYMGIEPKGISIFKYIS